MPQSHLESAIQEKIILHLCYHPEVSWIVRINGGGTWQKMKVGKRWTWFYRLYLRGVLLHGKGFSDLLVGLVGGRYLAIEVKRPGEAPTDEQARFIQSVRAGGGSAIVAESWSDVESYLEIVMGSGSESGESVASCKLSSADFGGIPSVLRAKSRETGDPHPHLAVVLDRDGACVARVGWVDGTGCRFSEVVLVKEQEG